MNYKGESYPKNLKLLLEEADKIAKELKVKLNRKSCPYLNDLYIESSCSANRQTSVFNQLGYTPNTKLSHKNKSDNEFKGLYVFGEEQQNGRIQPVYIGISRTVYRRLKQHGWGKRHNECTLAYLMASEKINHNKSRESIPLKELEKAKSKVVKFKVVMYPVKSDYELYFLEVTIAALLKTKWNSFKTH